jgi:pimeloyl-ACP methyl ester carboxylesterase
VVERWLSVQRSDGRTLEVVASDPIGPLPLLFHNGTPSAALLYPPLVDAVAKHGSGVVTFSRPGYGDSTPHRGRNVASVGDDSAAALHALGVEEFVTLGWSGGGPHALACAALLSERCRACASLAGVAPYGVDGLDWMAGMGEPNVEEFSAALGGDARLSKFLSAAIEGLDSLKADDLADSLGDLASDVDKAALTGDFAEYIAAVFRRAAAQGIAGWRDDDLAFTGTWGFDLAPIATPVSIWHGRQDRMVPFSHGEWLAANVSGAAAHFADDEGHVSLVVASLDEIVDDLYAAAANQPSK